MLHKKKGDHPFESNVNSDSIQTCFSVLSLSIVFESNVNSDSIQTLKEIE